MSENLVPVITYIIAGFGFGLGSCYNSYKHHLGRCSFSHHQNPKHKFVHATDPLEVHNDSDNPLTFFLLHF